MSINTNPINPAAFGVPIMGGVTVPPSTGKFLFVHSVTGSASNNGLDKDHPMATLAQALALCTASKGDVVLLMPGHAETVSVTITPIAGVSIIGLGVGRNRAVFTASTGAINTFTMSADDVLLRNFVIVGAASGNTGLITISGNNQSYIEMELQGGVTPTTLVTATAGGNNCVWQNCRIRSAAGTAIIWTATATGICADWLMLNNYVHGSSVRDIDTAVIACSKKSFTGLIVQGMTIIGVVTNNSVFDFNSSTGAVDGILSDCRMGWVADGTFANIIDAGGMLSVQNYGTDIVTAKGTAWPATTAS